MDMDIEALRWFQQVADGVTVTEVSELDRVSQSGVSRALSRLEAEVGVPLLRRSGRVLRMTRAGATFKRHVDKALHDLDDGLAALSELASPDTGSVAVAFQPSLGTWLVPELVAGFRAEHPRVEVSLHQIRDEADGSALAAGDVDLEITTRRSSDEAVRWRPLMTQPLRLALPAGHRAAGDGPLALSEVAAEPFVMLRRPFVLRRTCDELCERAGFVPRVAFETDDLATVGGLVAAGLGVAVVPVPLGPAADDPRPGVVHRAIADPDAVRHIGIAWSRERRLLPAATGFRRFVVERAERVARPA